MHFLITVRITDRRSDSVNPELFAAVCSWQDNAVPSCFASAMDFEPRDSWFETFGKRALTIGAILLCALILYWRSPLSSRFRFRSSFNLRTVSLPNRINTLAEGYPFAVRLKDQVAPKSELEAVTVLLKQHSDRFEPEMLSFYFVPRDSK